MAAPPEQTEISLISRGLYRIVSAVVGPECIVKLRRKRYDIFDRLYNCDTYSGKTRTLGGSRAEGYEFTSSDFDIMFIDRKVSVLFNPILSYNDNVAFPSLLLMESEECSPGYTLLRCLKCDRSNEHLYDALVLKANYLYVSSCKVKEEFFAHSFNQEHGPCQSLKYKDFEGDMAYTLKCPFWPPQASSFVNRAISRGWPTYEVLKDIMSDGCLFVPISSKQQTCSDLIDLEWRISFSLAEKKLIRSMNHCQFLCYGLSKIFLNEVLKKIPAIDDLLCSYFMKTAVFWEISDNPNGWSAETFLYDFLNVIRRLLKWVCLGYCPNFFMPENNMFYGKICRENQQTLLTVLCELYSEGYWCLLRCSSLHGMLSWIIRQPIIVLALPFSEPEYVPVSNIEREKLWAIWFPLYDSIPNYDLNRIKSSLKNTFNLTIDSEEIFYAVRLKVNHLLQRFEEVLIMSASSFDSVQINNRTLYQSTKEALAILYRTKTFFCRNYMIYATNIYKIGNFRNTIEMLYHIKHKLQSEAYMYEWNPDFDIMRTTREQGMPYDTFIKSFIVSCVEMRGFTSIDELKLECCAHVIHTGIDSLLIPPLVFINFLLILSYTRLEENHRRFDVLDELRVLLLYDENYHIPLFMKAISWEILGICQQICGDSQASLQSYRNALKDNFNFFKKATITRIIRLH